MTWKIFLGLTVFFLFVFSCPVYAELPECVEDQQPCTVGGTPCCGATSNCSGTFPNTVCQ